MKSFSRIYNKGLCILAIGLLAPMTSQAASIEGDLTNVLTDSSWVESYLSLQEPTIVVSPVEVLDVSSPLAIISDCADDTFSTPMAVPSVSDNPLASLSEGLDLTGIVLDKIINIGSKIWNIVVSNAPVVNLNMPSAFALPQGSQCWTNLENWEPPKSQLYTVTYRNMLGMNVVSFAYRVVYTAGGSFNGAGQYLANVTVHPAKVDVAWGFTFNSDVNVGQLVNLSSKADPEAGMELAVKWQVITPFANNQKTENYFIRGNGEISEL